MDRVRFTILTGQFMKVSGSKTKNMAKASIPIQITTLTRDNGQMICVMVKEHTHMPKQVQSTLADGKRAMLMVPVSSNIKTFDIR